MTTVVQPSGPRPTLDKPNCARRSGTHVIQVEGGALGAVPQHQRVWSSRPGHQTDSTQLPHSEMSGRVSSHVRRAASDERRQSPRGEPLAAHPRAKQHSAWLSPFRARRRPHGVSNHAIAGVQPCALLGVETMDRSSARAGVDEPPVRDRLGGRLRRVVAGNLARDRATIVESSRVESSRVGSSGRGARVLAGCSGRTCGADAHFRSHGGWGM